MTDPGEGDEPSTDYDYDDAVEAGDGPAANGTRNGAVNGTANGAVNGTANGAMNGAHDDSALGADPTDEHPVVQPDWVDDGLVPDTPAEVLGLDGALHSWPAAEDQDMTATAKLQQAIAEHIAVFTEDEVDDSWVEWPTTDVVPASLPRFGGNGNGHGGVNGGGAISRPPQPPFDQPVASASNDQPGHGAGPDPVAGHDPGPGWDGATPQSQPQPHQAPPQSQARPPAQPPQYQAPPSSPGPSPYDQPTDGPMPVDQVAVRKLGGFNFLSVSQWAVLPRDERARLIKSESVIFLNEGENVPLRSALLFFKGLNADPGDGGRRRR